MPGDGRNKSVAVQLFAHQWEFIKEMLEQYQHGWNMEAMFPNRATRMAAVRALGSLLVQVDREQSITELYEERNKKGKVTRK